MIMKEINCQNLSINRLISALRADDEDVIIKGSSRERLADWLQELYMTRGAVADVLIALNKVAR
jgi:hypothetical protein